MAYGNCGSGLGSSHWVWIGVVFYGLSCRWVGSHHAMWLDALIVG